jgi:hypothetical protein
MSYYTEGFISNPRSNALAWMKRFIKKYKQGCDEDVLVKGDKIVWADGVTEHSIYIKNGKFVIDGYEEFIDSELWDKYAEMRKLTGSISVRKPKKIAFPYDWSALSDEQVLENIQYLQKNYKKYKILFIDDNKIKIDNVSIVREHEENNGRVFLIINNKKYYRTEENGKELIDLMHVCKMRMVSFKDKASKWFKDNKDDVKTWTLGGTTIAVLFTFAYFMAIYSDKNAKQSRQELKREIINEVIDSLHKEQQKTINYNDSIKTR